MNYEIDQIQRFTVNEFQDDFENLINRVQNGEIFIIMAEGKNVLIVPYQDTIYNEEEELLQIHTKHNDAP